MKDFIYMSLHNCVYVSEYIHFIQLSTTCHLESHLRLKRESDQ